MFTMGTLCSPRVRYVRSGYKRDEATATWLLRCKAAGEAEVCRRYKYNGNMRLGDLARFLRVLDIPLVVGIEGDKMRGGAGEE
jgi:hypothetical protein